MPSSACVSAVLQKVRYFSLFWPDAWYKVRFWEHKWGSQESWKNCWPNSTWKKQPWVCMPLDLKALASWQHFTTALNAHTSVLLPHWGALSPLTVMAHNSLMPYFSKWETILMWIILVFPPKSILFIEGDFFCRNYPKGGSREV